eukprot:CAMPEP_0178372576 /NCGR_PEP_ID=MMETSP0689_2-20121128/1424_1 /TAXON_ID=160604 /ORGANISM="Amphidinium massartii, Strain CS-259" /LENGTH=48 /DNA_ID= /DNA_START= /DNA_END= /DNA_ORIENTATION=
MSQSCDSTACQSFFGEPAGGACNPKARILASNGLRAPAISISMASTAT